MDSLYNSITKINEILLDNCLVYLLLGIGIYFTIRLGFIQFRKLKASFKMTFGGLFEKSEKADKDGMSSIQSLLTAIAAQIGTGNLAGVATGHGPGGTGGHLLDVGLSPPGHGHHICGSRPGSKI